MPPPIRDIYARHVAPTSPFGPQFEVARAQGCLLFDAAGRPHLDFIAGISVANVGHCHPRVVAAVTQQAGLYAHTMVYGEHMQEPQARLGGMIADVLPPPLDAVYFLSTGSEANDAALKLAVKLTGRREIVAFRRAYHGDTVGALACFGDDAFRGPFGALLPGTVFLPFGDEGALEAISGRTAAVLVEPVQGEAGIVPPPPGFLEALRERCTRTGAVLIFDEVQTGFGRLGDWFAAGLLDVVPDVITAAKAMGGGYPLAGVIAPREMLVRFAADPPFSHITTFGGHPVSCAAGAAAMEVVRDENLLEHTRETGAFLLAELGALSGRGGAATAVRGVGLMIGVEHASEAAARAVVDGCRARGLILETTLLNERVVRFSPPLVVTRAQCDEAVRIYREVLEGTSG